MPHASHQPPAPEPPQKRAGSSDAARRHGLIWDHTLFHVVASLSSQASDGGSLEAQLSDHPTDRPHTQTRPGGAHPLVMFQEYHHLTGAFAAHPASFKPPDPHRDPGPGRVDHLHHHAPVTLSKSPRNQGTPPAGCTTQHQAPEYLGCEPRSSDGSPPNRPADHNDHATRSSR